MKRFSLQLMLLLILASELLMSWVTSEQRQAAQQSRAIKKTNDGYPEVAGILLSECMVDNAANPWESLNDDDTDRHSFAQRVFGTRYLGDLRLQLNVGETSCDGH